MAMMRLLCKSRGGFGREANPLGRNAPTGFIDNYDHLLNIINRQIIAKTSFSYNIDTLKLQYCCC